MVQVVLPNDANPLGFILGGTVMHLIDIAGAIACHRHTRSLLVTAAVDGLQFLHPIKVGDLIILRARVTAVWSTSLEVEVEVFSEETLTGLRKMTSLAYLTFVAVDRDSHRLPVPGLILESADDERRAKGGGSQARPAAGGAQGAREPSRSAGVELGRKPVVHLVDAQHLRPARVASELVLLAHDQRLDRPRRTDLGAQSAETAARQVEVEVVEDLDLLPRLAVAAERNQIVRTHLRALVADDAGLRAGCRLHLEPEDAAEPR